MKTSFDTWLVALAEAGMGGSALEKRDIPRFVRGINWSMIVAMPGDWTGGAMAATISASPDAPTPLATPSVTAADYDPVTDYTSWTLSLPGSTAWPTDADGDGVEAWPMLITFTPSGGDRMALIGGAFTVVGKV